MTEVHKYSKIYYDWFRDYANQPVHLIHLIASHNDMHAWENKLITKDGKQNQRNSFEHNTGKGRCGGEGLQCIPFTQV
jgi:hypothetical protein